VTRLVLARAAGLAIETEELAIDADSLPVVGRAVDTLRHLETLRGELLRRGRQRLERARRDGLEQGREQAEREAAAKLAASLVAIDAALLRDRAEREARMVELVLAVVRRVAGELGDAAVIAALARRSLIDLDPDMPVRVRVHPSVAQAVAAGFGDGAGPVVLEVLGDPAMEVLDCEIETEEGIVEAGLEVQLDGVRAALSGRPGGEA
jgi:type III secretion protein L